jgi:hypothetical protein
MYSLLLIEPESLKQSLANTQASLLVWDAATAMSA